MNKEQFLEELQRHLAALPLEEQQKMISYYSELLDDKMEEGMSEEDAVKSCGSLNEITYNIFDQVSMKTLAEEKTQRQKKKFGHSIWWYVLLLPVILVAAVIAIAIGALYLALWGVVIGLGALDVALGVAGVAILVVTVFKGIGAGIAFVLMMIGGGFICIGISCLLFRPTAWSVKKLISFINKLWTRLKMRFFAGSQV